MCVSVISFGNEMSWPDEKEHENKLISLINWVYAENGDVGGDRDRGGVSKFLKKC